MGNRVKGPAQLAGPDIKGSDVARRCRQKLADDATGDKQVFVYDARRCHRDGLQLRITAQVLAKINAPLLAKRSDRLTRVGVQTVQVLPSRHEQALFPPVSPI